MKEDSEHRRASLAPTSSSYRNGFFITPGPPQGPQTQEPTRPYPKKESCLGVLGTVYSVCVS